MNTAWQSANSFTVRLSACCEGECRSPAELREEAEAGELANKPPSKEVFLKMGAFGLLAARIGPGPHLKVPRAWSYP